MPQGRESSRSSVVRRMVEVVTSVAAKEAAKSRTWHSKNAIRIAMRNLNFSNKNVTIEPARGGVSFMDRVSGAQVAFSRRELNSPFAHKFNCRATSEGVCFAIL